MSVYRKANAGTCVFDESFKAGFYANGDLYVSYSYYEHDGRLGFFFERYNTGEMITTAMMNAKDQQELKAWIEGLGHDIMKKKIDKIVEMAG